MAIYRKGAARDLPLEDGTTVAVLGPLPEHLYDREEVGPMFRVVVLGGPLAGARFQLFADEIVPE